MTVPPPAPAADGRLTISDVNALSQREFVSRFGPIYEDSPWVAETAWAARPFASRADLATKLAAVAAAAGPDAQLLLIRSHPDLVGRAAMAGTLKRAGRRSRYRLRKQTVEPVFDGSIQVPDRLEQAERKKGGNGE